MSSPSNFALPTPFAGRDAQGITTEHRTRHLRVAQFEVGDYKNFVYVILDWQARTAQIIDPHINSAHNPHSTLNDVFDALRAERFLLTEILLTHSHWGSHHRS